MNGYMNQWEYKGTFKIKKKRENMQKVDTKNLLAGKSFLLGEIVTTHTARDLGWKGQC